MQNKEVGTASDYDDNIGTCSSTSDSSPAIDFSSKLRTVSPEEHVSECGSGGDEIVSVFTTYFYDLTIDIVICQLYEATVYEKSWGLERIFFND